MSTRLPREPPLADACRDRRIARPHDDQIDVMRVGVRDDLIDSVAGQQLSRRANIVLLRDRSSLLEQCSIFDRRVMRERAAELGGSCQLTPGRVGGTTVEAVLPLPDTAGG